MPRKKSPDAKDTVMSARFSEAETAMIDEARGTEDRSVFVRRATLAMADEKQDSRIRERLGVSIVDDRQPPGTVSVVAPNEGGAQVRSFALAPDEPAAKPSRKPAAKGPCEHRIPPGSYCTRCGRLI